MKEEKKFCVREGTSDRRNSLRSQTRLLTVFRLEEGGQATAPEIGYTRDISNKGIYFYASRKFDKGDRISLTVHFGGDSAGSENPPKLVGEGIVLRTERNRNTLYQTNISGTAVHFFSELAVSFT
jgi:hypothetical protein